MKEVVKIKVSQPMFEVGELEVFDNNIHSIVEEYSKMIFKEKDQILTQRIIIKQEQEIEKLNNIIKEAIEYINRHGYSNISNSYDLLYNGEIEELVKILEVVNK